MPDLPRLDSVSQSIAISGFTDDGLESGHIDLDDLIPAGSVVLGWKAEVTTRFTGGHDRTEFAVGTPSDPAAFCAGGWRGLQDGATSAHGDLPAAGEATDGIGVERRVRVSVRDVVDFGTVTGGAMTIAIYFVRTEA